MMRRSARCGVSLLEVLIVMTLLGVMLPFIALTLWTAARVQYASTSFFHAMLEQNAVADLFRTDIAAAVATPSELGIVTSNPYCLILRLPDARHVIYHADVARLERIVLNDTYEPIAVSAFNVGDNRQIDFFQSDDGLLHTLRISEIEPRLPHRRTVEIMAARAQ